MAEGALQVGLFEVRLDHSHGSHGALRCGYWMTSRSARRGPGTRISPSARERRDLPVRNLSQTSSQYKASCSGSKESQVQAASLMPTVVGQNADLDS